MNALNTEIKKVLERFKKTQSDIEIKVKQMEWVQDARKLLERRPAELLKLQKQLPAELKRLKKFVDGQKKELEKLLTKVKTRKKTTRRKGPIKPRARKATT